MKTFNKYTKMEYSGEAQTNEGLVKYREGNYICSNFGVDRVIVESEDNLPTYIEIDALLMKEDGGAISTKEFNKVVDAIIEVIEKNKMICGGSYAPKSEKELEEKVDEDRGQSGGNKSQQEESNGSS